MDIRLTRKIYPCKPKSTGMKISFNVDLTSFFVKHLGDFRRRISTNDHPFSNLKNEKKKFFFRNEIIIPRGSSGCRTEYVSLHYPDKRKPPHLDRDVQDATALEM